MTKSVLIVGTGLAASGAVRAFIDAGKKITVFDTGLELPSEFKNRFSQHRFTNPVDWTPAMHEEFFSDAVGKFGSIPKKTLFGSTYFYGESRAGGIFSKRSDIPPLSYASGGLSAGWGAAVLPPDSADIRTWPISTDIVDAISKDMLARLPYSYRDDALSLNFLVPSGTNEAAIKLSKYEQHLLSKLVQKNKIEKGKLLIGQARQLVRCDGLNQCLYCGHCMGGCVFGAIYSAKDDFDFWQKSDLITLERGRLVVSVEQVEDNVKVEYLKEDGSKHSKFFSKVFLAAGAVNSTRIYLQSLNQYNVALTLKTRGGFVLPMVSIRKIREPTELKNTMPSFFIELKEPINDTWVHTQVSVGNELLERQVRGLCTKLRLPKKINQIVLSRLAVGLVNFHSVHGGTYELTLKRKDNSRMSELHSKHVKRWPRFAVLFNVIMKLTKVLCKGGIIPIWPAIKLNSGSYHIGCSLPMSTSPSPFETDELGVTTISPNVHFVDSSSFPDLPGTSVGLLSMVNAYRIAKEVIKIHDQVQ